MSKFQIITLTAFIIFIIAGVTAFALYRGSSSFSTQLPPITVWGTFPQDIFDQYVGKVNNGLTQSISVRYVQKSSSAFGREFISALARGTGPDAILIPADLILPHQDKLAIVPYTALPQRTFIDTYVQASNIYLSSNGLLAIPFSIDPLVMYWNRDNFNSAGIATSPRFWDEFYNISTKLTIKDQNGNIRKSSVAMGDFSNITNARELLGTLIMQVGGTITKIDSNNVISSGFKANSPVDISPAIQFFTQFADPNNSYYSWNKSMSNDKIAFLTGNLSTYFGFASEIKDIREKNPNLNFDVASLPQVKTGGLKANYARLYGFSVVKASPNQNAVFQIISLLTLPQFISSLSQNMYLPSVRNDLIAQGNNDPYLSVFDKTALISKTWLDADPNDSRSILGSMVQSVVSGQKNIRSAIRDASDEYDVALQRALQ